MTRTVAALAAAVCVAACGNANVVTPADIAQKYVYAVAEGNYPGACALLDTRARRALVAATRSHLGCAALLARCLPPRSSVSPADQSQLLYVNVGLRMTRAGARATLSGLPVARAIERVTLVHEHMGWRLASPGRQVTHCLSRLRRGAHDHRARPKHG